jgi:putative hemolysin
MNQIILGLIAIILKGIFEGSETAFSRANWIRLATWRKKSVSASLLRLRAGPTLKLLEHREHIIIITLIFTNLFITIATAVFSNFFIVNFGPAYTAVAIIVVLFLSLIIGDFIPKVIAQAFPEYWAIIVGPLMQLLSSIFSPILPKKKTESYHTLSRQDFLYLLKEKETKESLTINQMAKALFDFSKMTIAEIIVPSERIVGFSVTSDFREVRKIIEKYRFSRYPVFREKSDEIVGLVHIKNLLLAVRSKKVDISDISRKPYFVQASEKAMTVLKSMSRKGEHLAIVRSGTTRNGNTENATIGIITLEDLIEEVVGEIRSET